MIMEIRIITRYETDNPALLEEIVKRLNSRWKGQEDMEMRLDIYCDDIAKEMGGVVGYTDDGSIVFNFTGLNLKSLNDPD